MKMGLTLSGGGARGIAHLGVIKALEEFGLTFNVLSGTSAGSIVGSLYTYGYSPDDIMKIISSTSFYKSIRPAWALGGLLNLERLGDVLLKHLPENNFNALKIPMTIAATDIRKGKAAYFTTGELIPAILASCCVPAVFNPIHFNHAIYIDGGIVDNLPASSIRSDCDFLIGSHCNHISPEFDALNFRGVIERTLLIAINGNTIESKKLCDVLIEPPGVGQISGFQLARAKDLFDIGYSFTRDHFKTGDFSI
jgi:NTE family protein